MSFKDCLTSAGRQGVMDPDDVFQSHQRYDELAKLGLRPDEIRARMLREKEVEAREEERTGLLMQIKSQGLLNSVFSYKDARGRSAPHKALWMLMEHVGHFGSQMDLETLKNTITTTAQREFLGLLHEFRKGWVTGDWRRKGPELVARMENIVRELFGKDTGDLKAKQFAEAWTRIAEKLRVRFNDAGGAIGKLERWGLPQVHNAEALLKAGGSKAGSPEAKNFWIKYITPLLDRNAMKNPLTGYVLSDAELAETLGHVYDTIVSEGWSKREPMMRRQGKGALYKQHADHRFLLFKDADSWLKYQKDFGSEDLFSTMMGHLATMARDIAAMEILGPNPEAMLAFLQQSVIKAMGHGSDVSKAINKAEAAWAHYRGSANIPVSDKWAKAVSTVRNWISGASLGSAAISALSDHATDAVTRAFTGLPILPAFTGWIQQIGPNAELRAARNAVILHSGMHAWHQQVRFIGSISGKEVSSFINDRVLAASGLNAMTEGRKAMFGLSFQATAADMSRYGWNELPNQGLQAAAFRRTLERHGFDEASWDAIRVAHQEQPSRGDGFVGPAGAEGTGFLRPQEIEEVAGRELAERYQAMILRERRFAVVEPGLMARSAFIGTNQPGTFAGELLRSGGQFKGFGIEFVMLHGERIFRELAGQNPARGAAYFGALLITSTLMGAVAMQLKDIANGRDPRRMDLSKYGAKFWGAAMLQGGGLGIYGDFLFSDVNRFGGSLAGTAMGPVVERLDAIRRLTIGNALEFAEGKERTNFGRELSNVLRTGMPGFSSWWFAREAWNRVLMDQVQYMLDADAHSAFRRQMQQRRRDYEQDFWWRPGEQSPQRGPDFGRMLPGY